MAKSIRTSPGSPLDQSVSPSVSVRIGFAEIFRRDARGALVVVTLLLSIGTFVVLWNPHFLSDERMTVAGVVIFLVAGAGASLLRLCSRKSVRINLQDEKLIVEVDSGGHGESFAVDCAEVGEITLSESLDSDGMTFVLFELIDTTGRTYQLWPDPLIPYDRVVSALRQQNPRIAVSRWEADREVPLNFKSSCRTANELGRQLHSAASCSEQAR